MDVEELLLDIFVEASNGRIETNRIYNIVFNTIVENNSIDTKSVLSKLKKIFTMINTNIDFTLNKEEIMFQSKEFDELFVPTLIINDFDLFKKKISEYIDYAEAFYLNLDNEYIEKNITILLFSNATQEDFNNPIDFIDREIKYIKDRTFDNYLEPKIVGQSNILDSKVKVSIKKEPIFQETPYSFNVELLNNLNEEEIYKFPKIRFGIDNKTCYIKAIQNNKEICNNEVFLKKIKRKLNKVNQNFEQEKFKDNVEYPENLTGIVPSFLLVTTMFLSLLKQNDINDIKLVSFLPLRWNSKEIKYMKIKESDKFKLSEDQVETKYNDNLENHYEVQRNLSDKLIRNFRRLSYHMKNIESISYPYEYDEYYNIRINDNYESNNELLNEMYNLINCDIKRK